MAKNKLSIIIVSFNTKEILKDCLLSLEKVKKEASFKVIVSDNGSTDGSCEMIKSQFPKIVLLENKQNLGFAAGNNKAKKEANTEFVLFLNSDTLVKKNTLKECLAYLEARPKVGAMTCKVVLKSGRLDKDTRRSFPTPWVAFTHFSHLDRIFPKSKIFSKYWYGYIDTNQEHEIDVLQGAFCLARRDILDKVEWFDERYFLDGEDVDLCWKIKEAGYKIMYYPKVKIVHLKKASKKKVKSKSVSSGVAAMEMFYKNRLWKKYPLFINYSVLLGIRMLQLLRSIKVLFG